MARSAEEGETIPLQVEWSGPLAWLGTPLRPADCYGVEFPSNALYVRGEVRLTTSIAIGPGMNRESERSVPGLIRLEQGKPAEVYLAGLDTSCWTFKRVRAGRRVRWQLISGSDFSAQGEEVDMPLAGLVRVIVQSVLPAAGSGRYVSFAIDGSGRGENFVALVDPDPHD